MMNNRNIFVMLIVLSLLIASAERVFAEEIVIYSARNKYLTRKAFSAFTHETGIKINWAAGK